MGEHDEPTDGSRRHHERNSLMRNSNDYTGFRNSQIKKFKYKKFLRQLKNRNTNRWHPLTSPNFSVMNKIVERDRLPEQIRGVDGYQKNFDYKFTSDYPLGSDMEYTT